MIHLTDKELIDYTIKFSDDPEKVRLATAMERITGAIIDDLVDAGMDDTFCTFRSEWGGEYHPGRYISLLEDEIRIRDEDILQLREELEELKARTVLDLLVELRQEIKTAEWGAKLAHIIKQGQQALKSTLLTPTLSTLKNKWKYTFKDCHENLYTITATFTPPATETQAINNIASVSCPEGFTILSVTQENQ
mgnify:CR=1 FL=1